MTRSPALPSSVLPVELAVLQARLTETGSHWDVETIVTPELDRGYVLLPTSGDDADGPTFAIWPNGPSFCVDELHGDAYRTIARCPTFADVLFEIGRRLHICCAAPPQSPTARATACLAVASRTSSVNKPLNNNAPASVRYDRSGPPVAAFIQPTA
jgi:hypothetical protein